MINGAKFEKYVGFLFRIYFYLLQLVNKLMNIYIIIIMLFEEVFVLICQVFERLIRYDFLLSRRYIIEDIWNYAYYSHLVARFELFTTF